MLPVTYMPQAERFLKKVNDKALKDLFRESITNSGDLFC